MGSWFAFGRRVCFYGRLRSGLIENGEILGCGCVNGCPEGACEVGMGARMKTRRIVDVLNGLGIGRG